MISLELLIIRSNDSELKILYSRFSFTYTQHYCGERVEWKSQATNLKAFPAPLPLPRKLKLLFTVTRNCVLLAVD